MSQLEVYGFTDRDRQHIGDTAGERHASPVTRQGSSTAGELVMATKRSLMAMRARGPSRQPGCHKLGCRDLKRNDRLEDAFRTAIGERWRCSAQP